ncbi:MAG: protein kinase [Pyrinomonadaceae bacterium]
MNQSAAKHSKQALPFSTAGETLQGRYRIVRQLGAGGMGAVYEAVDDRLQTTVAIKETFSVDDRLRRQFEQEARLLAQLSHPALPRVSDYFTEEGRAFLVMQFIAGDDLAQIISQQPGPFPRAHVIAWADQLLDALIYLHTRERQIIHRDIKPHNLKLTASGQIALLDFGLAKMRGADQSTTQSSNSIFGYTRRYSPLEQIQDQGTSPQSDIYALGATLYHLLTGIKPPDALTRAAALANSQRDLLQSGNEVHSLIGPELALVLNKAMALNASDRYESAAHFREALKRVGRRDFQSLNNRRAANSSSGNSSTTRDPFDGYSILRPEEELFQIAKRKPAPAFFATLVAIVLVAIAVAYPVSVLNSAARSPESATRVTARPASDAAALRQPKSEPQPKSRVIPNSSSSPVGDLKHVNEPPKRHVQNARAANPPSAKPPRFSIAP